MTRPQLGEAAQAITVSGRACEAYARWRGLDARRARDELEPLLEECRETQATRRDGREQWRLRDRVLGLDLTVAVDWDGPCAVVVDATVRPYRGGRRGRGSEVRKGRKPV